MTKVTLHVLVTHGDFVVAAVREVKLPLEPVVGMAIKNHVSPPDGSETETKIESIAYDLKRNMPVCHLPADTYPANDPAVTEESIKALYRDWTLEVQAKKEEPVMAAEHVEAATFRPTGRKRPHESI